MATFKEFDTGSDQITQLCYFCDSSVSDGFCGVCEDYMCQTCFDMHTKAKACRHHVLLDSKCLKDNKKTHAETCKRHPNQFIKFYCVAHKIVGCVECFFPEHRNCNYQNIETAAELFRDSGEDNRLKTEIQRLENTHSEYTKQYEDDKETVVVINNTVVKDVKSFTHSVTSYVAQVEKRMLEQSERLRIENENWLERRSDDLDNVGTEIEKCKMKLENEDRVDRLFISAIELGPAIEKLRKNIASIGRQHAVTKYEFQPNKLIMEMTNGSGSLGDICILPGASVRANKAESKGRQNTSNPNRVTFKLCSLDESKIKDNTRLQEACIEEEMQEQTFSDSIIMTFGDNQANQVQQIADQHQLKVDLKRSEGNLIINGLTANVNAAANEFHKLLRKVQSDEKDRQSAELMARLVQWYFIEVTDTGKTLTQYDKGLNYRIELAFRTKSTNNIAFVADGTKFLIDFNDMIEYPEGNKQEQMTVIRRDLVNLGSFEAPYNWSDFNGNQKVVVLHPTDRDYKTLEQTFLQSAGSGFTVEKIQRIMNKTLWAQYQAKKKQLKDQNPKGTQNERLLWHGTAPEAVDNINAYGFNRSYSGKNYRVYGDGVYLAVSASYLARNTYSRPDPTGVKRMYYCLVLTGEFTIGQSGMRVPPRKATGDCTATYDSVVDRPDGPEMYIIFHDNQAYPEYLVSFKQK